MPFHTLAAAVALAAWLAAAGALPQPSSTCDRRCGNVDIPYPFGIGTPESPDHCAMPGFYLSCIDTGNGSFRPFDRNVEVVGVSLQQGQVRMLNQISSACYNTSTRVMDYTNWELNYTGTPYRFSDTNKFTAIGCNTLAYIVDQDDVGKFMSGCVAMCRGGNTTILTNGSCSGIGCCQTAIPKEMQYYLVRFDPNFNTSQIYRVSRCSYAVLMDSSNFTFLPSYATSPEFKNINSGRAPLLMDWAIRDETCESARMKLESYACASTNSDCFNSLNGPGYICNCTKGFRGNPYLLNGCQDVDECTDDPKNYPCGSGGLCQNKVGGFQCYRPPGTRGDASLGPCEKELTKRQRMAIGKDHTDAKMFTILILLYKC